jgi:hypothetical protein
MELQLVILLPHQFLPDGQALLRRNDDHGLTSYIVTNDGLLRATQNPTDTNAPLFPLLPFPTRERNEKLNPWLVVLNAAAKFQRLSETNSLAQLHPSVREVAEQTMKIIDLLYTDIVPSKKFEETYGPMKRFSRRNIPEVGYMHKLQGGTLVHPSRPICTNTSLIYRSL